MGNHCCPPSSPCGTVEERSGLLRDESKQGAAAVGDADAIALFQNSPEAEDMRISEKTTMKEEEKEKQEEEKEKQEKEKQEGEKEKQQGEEKKQQQSDEAAEKKACNTQENGPLLQKEPSHTATPPPSRGPELRAQEKEEDDVKGMAAGPRPAEPQPRTLDSPQPEPTAAEPEVLAATSAAPVRQHPAAFQEKIPDAVAQAVPEAAPSHNPSCPEADTQRESEAPTPHSPAQEAPKKEVAAEPVGDFPSSSPNSEVLAAVCQVPQSNTEAPSSSVPNEAVSKNGSSSGCEEEEEAPEGAKPCDTVKPPGGSEPKPEPEPEPTCCVEGNCVGRPLTSAPAESSPRKQKLDQDQDQDQDPKPDPDPEQACISLKEVATVENTEQDPGEETAPDEQEKDNDVPKARGVEEAEKEGKDMKEKEMKKEEEGEASTNNGEADAGELYQELNGQEETPASVCAEAEDKDSDEDSFVNSDEDLYRGVEELSASPASLLGTLPKVEDRCSLDPVVDVLSYSRREWKGNTAKSTLIRKGYSEMSQRFSSLRRVRGDNYCALRATLFQVLSHSARLPAWLQQEDVAVLPKELEACEGLMSQWTFPAACPQADGPGDAAQQLRGYVELLRDRWQEAVGCASAGERQRLCERLFRGGEEELGLLEALKLLMLGRAVELHAGMQAGRDVPLFCWLLFARDSSGCPNSFLSNHLSRVGLSAGLEQVEMFLLGYALRCTIQVYRLYMADTEEFVTYYPDDHKDDWPTVCLVTEDDRHYNVPVEEEPPPPPPPPPPPQPEELDSS
ncbi:uncharacterized protein LOC143006764 isoform X2 [Genypterus blacodes]|uniref:uncharacterized protein LOC143006764 isoform X2 n=1 Tax=Genypterus blacodes TaxID=154954 RepID=UPI003F76B95E